MKRTRSLLTALILAGCATAPSVQDGHARSQVEVDSHLLLADIALDRQDRNTAMRELLAAAMLSEEPGPAERATRIAHELELTEQGLTAGARWRELASQRRAAGLVPRRLRDARESHPARDHGVHELHALDRRSQDRLRARARSARRRAVHGHRDCDHALAERDVPERARGPVRARASRAALRGLRARARECGGGQQVERRLDRGAALVRAHVARHGQDGRQPRDRRGPRGPARRARGAAPVRGAVALGGAAARGRDAAQRDPRGQSGPARSHSRAGVPRDDGAARRGREALLQRSARRAELSQRGVLLLRQDRRDGARFLASDALVCARHRRHARRRGATAHGADPVRGAERPRERGAPSARLRRRESAFRDGHARGAGAAPAADGAAGGSDARARRGARVDARRSGAARRSCAALRGSGAKRRRARRARRRRGRC